MGRTKKNEKRKKKERGYWRGQQGIRSAFCRLCGMLCGLWLMLLAGGRMLSVTAAPAVLDSPSAVVYEQMSEKSTPLGNLIQYGSFEYLGDVTAEDGSVWHAVRTQTGTSGYIRGDLAVSVQEGREEPEGGSGTTAPQENPAETTQQNQTETPEENQSGAPQENQAEMPVGAEEIPQESPGPSVEALAGAGEETVAEEQDGETGEAAPLGEGVDEGAEDTPQQIQPVHNTQAKTYAPGAVGKKIKEPEGAGGKDAAADTGVFRGEEESRVMDWSGLVCAAVAVVSVVAALIFINRVRRTGREECAYAEDTFNRRAGRSGKRKKKSRHRKSRKYKKQKEGRRAHG